MQLILSYVQLLVQLIVYYIQLLAVHRACRRHTIHFVSPLLWLIFRGIQSQVSNELDLRNWRAQLGLWAVISAQLVLGNDLTTMSSRTRDLLLSPGYVAVNQDELGVPGRLLRIGDRNSAELWAKPLADRAFACVLWFRNQTQAVQHRESKRLHSGSIELDFRDLGFTGVAEVIDIWTNASYGMFTDYFLWAANSTDLGGAEFVYVRPVKVENSGCSAWGGECLPAGTKQPDKDGMFW